MRNYGKLIILAFFCAVALLVPSFASALLVSGSGTGTGGVTISASADFTLTTHDFDGTGPGGSESAIQIILTNTSPNPTTVRGNLLTGLFWTFSGVASLSTAIDGQADAGTVKLSTTGAVQNTGVNWDIASAVDGVLPPGGPVNGLDGGYQLSNGPFGTANNGQSYAAYEYGIATIAYGLGGWLDSNAMGNGDVHDYGIVSSGFTSMGGGARNVIQTSATFWIPYTGGSIPEFTNYAFTFGSLPDNVVTPEPVSMFLFGSGLMGAAAIIRRRFKK